MKTALSTVTLAALAVAAVVALFLGGWWLREYAVNRDAEIRRDSFEYQETRADEIVRQSAVLAGLDADLAGHVTAEQRGALTAQREAARRQLCNIATDLNPQTATPTVAQIITEEC